MRDENFVSPNPVLIITGFFIKTTNTALYFLLVTLFMTGCVKDRLVDNSQGNNGVADITPPSVTTVVPGAGGVSVPVNSNVIVEFTEAMDAATVSSTTLSLKQGTTNVTGTVSYTGTKATFTPAGNLQSGTIYVANITTAVHDLAGNAMIANYSWSFTTSSSAVADVIAPTVLTVVPANSASAIAISSTITANFSEAMSLTTITAATFTVKQGTTAVTGAISYSGTTATFTPTAALTPGVIYTCAINTGAKDVAGNALVSGLSWSFTTAATAPVVGMSFATDVVPVLTMCNNCHTHGWTTSSVATTFYTNLVGKGYVNATTYTSAKIYTKINGGHPGSSKISAANTNKIINWMKEGSKNN